MFKNPSKIGKNPSKILQNGRKITEKSFKIGENPSKWGKIPKNPSKMGKNPSKILQNESNERKEAKFLFSNARLSIKRRPIRNQVAATPKFGPLIHLDFHRLN